MNRIRPTDRLLAWPEVDAIVPYSRQHISRLEKGGRFPERVQVGLNRVAWRESDILAWLERLPRGPLPTRSTLDGETSAA